MNKESVREIYSSNKIRIQETNEGLLIRTLNGSATQTVEARPSQPPLRRFILESPKGVAISPLIGTHLIGRDEACDLAILADRSVSRVHALLHVRVDRVIVRDLGSGTGTFVNGRRLVWNEHRTLAAKDQLKIGEQVFSITEVS